MKIRHLLMAGVALVVGVPLALAATPAEEKETTKQLNQQQLASPGTSASVGEAATLEKAAGADADTFASAESDSDLDAVKEVNVEAGDAEASAEAEASTAEATDEAASDAAAGEEMASGQPASNETAGGPAATDQAAAPEASAQASVALTDVKNPQDTLAASKVETATGEAIGEVQSIQLGADGRVSGIVVEADSSLGEDVDPVTIEAADLTYDPSRNVLVTQLNKDQIKNLAQAKTE